MTETPSPESILNFEGPKGETLFRRFVDAYLPLEWEPKVQAEVDEVFGHLDSKDDRAVAVVGALVIEDSVNQLVAAHVPGYKKMAESRDFGLSMRIELARALRLCPSRLLGAADTVRAIRNDFAHKLALKMFDECKREHLTSAQGHLRQIQPTMVAGKTNREIFTSLVCVVSLALRGYSLHVERLNQYVREEEAFWGAFHQYCVAKYPQRPEGRVP
jgi:hypothetical protein